MSSPKGACGARLLYPTAALKMALYRNPLDCDSLRRTQAGGLRYIFICRGAAPGMRNYSESSLVRLRARKCISSRSRGGSRAAGHGSPACSVAGEFILCRAPNRRR